MALNSALAREVFVVRAMAASSLQLAYVAAGRLDAFWETGEDLEDWLAGSLLVEESGGTVTALDGGRVGSQSGGILATNTYIHDALLCAARAPAE